MSSIQLKEGNRLLTPTLNNNGPIQQVRSGQSLAPCYVGLGLSVVLGLASTGGAIPRTTHWDLTIGDQKVLVPATRDEKIDDEAPSLDLDGAFPDNLNWIKDSGISFSSVANLFGVTRKTLYAWMDGGAVPRGNRAGRVAALRVALESIPARNERLAFMSLVDHLLPNGNTVRSLINRIGATREQLESDVRAARDQLAPELAKATTRSDRRVLRSSAYVDEYPSA